MIEDCAIGQMAQSVDALRACLFAIRDEEVRPQVWVAVSTQSEHGAARMAAIRAFTRVAMNEMPEMDIRFIEIAADVPNDALTTGLSEILRHPGREREWCVTAQGVTTARLLAGLPLAAEPAMSAMSAMRLHFPVRDSWKISSGSRPSVTPRPQVTSRSR
jgi:hypothetical protein